jgi:hypothetical protein
LVSVPRILAAPSRLNILAVDRKDAPNAFAFRNKALGPGLDRKLCDKRLKAQSIRSTNL